MTDHSRFASEKVKELLVAGGLHDLETAFELGEPLDSLHQRRASRHQFKQVVSLEINAADGPVRVYIKRQWRVKRWLPRFTDVRHGLAFQCTPIREWRGLRMLSDLGFDVAEPLALFWHGLGVAQGAVVTRGVPPTLSLADLIERNELERLETPSRQSLISAALAVIEQLHRGGLAWRSIKAKHFYPEPLAGDRWRIWLIDCEGVYLTAGRRDYRRDWRNFLDSVAGLSASFHESVVAASRGRSILGLF